MTYCDVQVVPDLINGSPSFGLVLLSLGHPPSILRTLLYCQLQDFLEEAIFPCVT